MAGSRYLFYATLVPHTANDRFDYIVKCALVHWISTLPSLVVEVCHAAYVHYIYRRILTYVYNENKNDAFRSFRLSCLLCLATFIRMRRDLVAIVLCVCMNLHKCLLVRQTAICFLTMNWKTRNEFSCAFFLVAFNIQTASSQFSLWKFIVF